MKQLEDAKTEEFEFLAGVSGGREFPLYLPVVDGGKPPSLTIVVKAGGVDADKTMLIVLLSPMEANLY